MNRFSLWLRWHDVRFCGIPLERFHQKSWLRHLMWPPLRLRLQLLYMETKFNYGGRVRSLHRWLQLDIQAVDYLSEDEYKQYYSHLNRLRNRANEQSFGSDVRAFRRATHGWLSFRQSPQTQLHIGWPRT